MKTMITCGGAQDVLGWEPVVGLEGGLERTVGYFEKLCARMS